MRARPMAVAARISAGRILFQVRAHGVGGQVQTNAGGAFAALAAIAQLKIPDIGNEVRFPSTVLRDLAAFAVVVTVFTAEAVGKGI